MVIFNSSKVEFSLKSTPPCTFVIFLLLMSSSVLNVTAHTLYVTPDDYQSDINDSNPLSHYLKNSSKYFTSNTLLYFLPGNYTLNKDLIIEDLVNITIIGNYCMIKCTNSFVGILMIRLVNITILNVEIIHCRKNYYSSLLNRKYFEDVTSFDQPRLQWNAALHLLHCVSITVTNVSITIETGTDGLLVINPKMRSVIENVKIFVTASHLYSQFSTSNGMILFNYLQTNFSRLFLRNFTYQQQYCLSTVNDNIFYMVFIYNERIEVYITRTTIKNLCNARAIYYYYNLMNEPHKLIFYNCKIYNNTASNLVQLHLFLFSVGSSLSTSRSREHSSLRIFNCTFYRNVNLSSIINVRSTSSDCALQLSVNECNFHHNHIPNIIKQTSREVNWRQLVTVVITSTVIFSNTFNEGHNLISMDNGVISFHKSIIINNIFYDNIVKLSLSSMNIGSLYIFSNHARHILKIVETSYILIRKKSTLIATNNTVYSVLAQELYREETHTLCYFQLSEPNFINTHIEIVHNMCTSPMHLFDNEAYFNRCKLIYSDTLTIIRQFKFTNIIDISNIGIDRNDIGIIPSSICKCTNSFKYECATHELGSVFPGQTITAKLIVPRLSLSSLAPLIVESARLPANGCRITRAAEMVQMHTSAYCNMYNYTVWSDKPDCELYLSVEGIAEIFYIKLLPCPAGFSLQYHVQSCHCDTVLDSDVISVTTCNLADGTILRPANSWISADTVNGSHRYHVSSQCPFDYCLPYSSYLNLSTPDMQCQFNRSGVLCGHCQQGLSAVFGSSQCKKCSNIYLFIIIPIAIAGIVLVITLFVFNLTVTNGTVNTFIFYVNIINTSHSTLLPNCHSPICVILFIFNLDLGIETCFYNNMTNYFKMCLQLAFPLYLIMISSSLIIGSRYSSRMQRLTARKGLHVLATLFLLSYTKILSLVCYVLFFYTQTTHLPSRQTQLFWSADTSVRLFGVKFTILFMMCLVIFSVLILFNTLLLFTRFLLRFKIISKFKPLLDPYFGPYKDKFIYWTGLQLLIRALYFSFAALSSQIGVFSGIIMAGILLCVQFVAQPFKT